MPNLLGFVASTMLATATSGLFPEALEHILILEAGNHFVGGTGPVLYPGMDADLQGTANEWGMRWGG